MQQIEVAPPRRRAQSAMDGGDPVRSAMALCEAARELVGPAGPFRVRVLLDMLVHELGREEKAVRPLRSGSPGGS